MRKLILSTFIALFMTLGLSLGACDVDVDDEEVGEEEVLEDEGILEDEEGIEEEIGEEEIEIDE